MSSSKVLSRILISARSLSIKCRYHSYGPGGRVCATFHCGFHITAALQEPPRLCAQVPQWSLDPWSNDTHLEGRP